MFVVTEISNNSISVKEYSSYEEARNSIPNLETGMKVEESDLFTCDGKCYILSETSCIEINKLVPDGKMSLMTTEKPYAGVDVEYIDDKETDDVLFRPRVLFEKPDDANLSAYVWDGHSEDFSSKTHCAVNYKMEEPLPKKSTEVER